MYIMVTSQYLNTQNTGITPWTGRPYITTHSPVQGQSRAPGFGLWQATTCKHVNTQTVTVSLQLWLSVFSQAPQVVCV